MEQRTIMEYEPEQLEPYDFRRAMEEASRCLLCEDAPCTKVVQRELTLRNLSEVFVLKFPFAIVTKMSSQP